MNDKPFKLDGTNAKFIQFAKEFDAPNIDVPDFGSPLPEGVGPVKSLTGSFGGVLTIVYVNPVPIDPREYWRGKGCAFWPIPN